MKICIVGNSHAGALKRALNRASRPTHDFDVFAQRGGGGPRLEVKDGRVFAIEGRGGFDQGILGDLTHGLDLAPFDAVLFAAAGLAAHFTESVSHPLNNMLHAGFAKSPLAGRPSLSGAIMSASLERCLLTTANMQALRVIRSVFAGPLVIITCPLPARHFDTAAKSSDLPAQYGDRLAEFMTWYYREQIRVIANEARALGAACVPPPEEFMAAGFTPDRYCSRDPWHCNADYGDITLDRALQLLDTAINA